MSRFFYGLYTLLSSFLHFSVFLFGSNYRILYICSIIIKTKEIMKESFLQTRPEAKVTEKINSNGDIIVYVNGETAFNKEDRYNASNWLTMMENAYQRSI